MPAIHEAKTVVTPTDTIYTKIDFTHLDAVITDTLKSPDVRDSLGHLSPNTYKGLVTNHGLLDFLKQPNSNPQQVQRYGMSTVNLLARHNPGLGLITGINLGLIYHTLNLFSQSSEQRDFWQQMILDGESAGLAITELKTSGSSVMSNLASSHERDNGTITLSKVAKRLTGNHLRKFVIFLTASGKGRDRTRALTAVYQKDIRSKLIRTHDLELVPYAESFIDNLPLDEDTHLLAEIPALETQHFANLLAYSRFGLSANARGTSLRALSETVEHTHTRKIGADSLGSIDTVRFQVAHMYAQSFATQIYYDWAVENINPEMQIAHLLPLANLTKAFTTNSAYHAAEQWANLSGGDAFYKEHPALSFKNSMWAFARFEGPNEMLSAQSVAALFAGVWQRDSTNGSRTKIYTYQPYKDSPHKNPLDYLANHPDLGPHLNIWQATSQLQLYNNHIRILALTPEQLSRQGNQWLFGQIMQRLFVLGHLHHSMPDQFDGLDLEDDPADITMQAMNLEIADLLNHIDLITNHR